MKKATRVLVFTAVLAAVVGAHSEARAMEMTSFGLQGSLLWGAGSYKSANDSIQSRTINSMAIQVLPGYKVMDFMFGPFAEYRFVGQTTDPATVASSNVRGHGYLLGVGAAYQLMQLHFTGGFEFLGTYTQSNTDPTGAQVQNKKPMGFVLQAGYGFMPMFSADVRWALVNYGEDSVGGVTNDVSSNKRRQMDFSIGVSAHL